MSTFRDELGNNLRGWIDDTYIDDHVADLIADAVLASAPMQAIRDALTTLGEYGGPNYLAVGLGLPLSVIDWAAEGNV